MARRGAQDQRQSQARGRCRPAELFVALVASARRHSERSEAVWFSCQQPPRTLPGPAKGVETKKPAVISDGRLRQRAEVFCGPTLRNAYRNGWEARRRGSCARGSDHLGGHVADAGRGQADRACGGGGEVEHPSLDEGAAVVDRDDNAATPMGDAQLGAERQRPVGSRQGVLVEALAGGGLAAGFIAVERGNAREAAAGPRRRGDGRIGVPPVRLLGGVVGGGVSSTSQRPQSGHPPGKSRRSSASAGSDRVTPGADFLIFSIL